MPRIAKSPKVLVFGTFDGVHMGHKHFLLEAKKLGFLIVSVASDKSAKSLGKNPQNSQSKRIKYISDLSIADKVIKGDDLINSWSAVNKYKPDIIAVGYDQRALYSSLTKLKQTHNFKIQKIKSHMPKKYHSSIINKQ